MLLAATMSKESIIERLSESLEEYKEAQLLNNEEALDRAEKELFVSVNLYIMNFTTKGDIKTAMKHIREMDQMEKAQNFFKTEKN